MSRRVIKTNADNFEERKDDLPACKQISDALSCAECCETPAELDINLDDALAAAEALIKAIRELREGK